MLAGNDKGMKRKLKIPHQATEKGHRIASPPADTVASSESSEMETRNNIDIIAECKIGFLEVRKEFPKLRVRYR